MIEKRHAVLTDKDGNILTGKATFIVSWGDMRVTVDADDHEDAACRMLVYFALTKEPAPPYEIIKVKPKGKGSRDLKQTLFIGRDYAARRIHERYGVLARKVIVPNETNSQTPTFLN